MNKLISLLTDFKVANFDSVFIPRQTDYGFVYNIGDGKTYGARLHIFTDGISESIKAYSTIREAALNFWPDNRILYEPLSSLSCFEGAFFNIRKSETVNDPLKFTCIGKANSWALKSLELCDKFNFKFAHIGGPFNSEPQKQINKRIKRLNILRNFGDRGFEALHSPFNLNQYIKEYNLDYYGGLFSVLSKLITLFQSGELPLSILAEKNPDSTIGWSTSAAGSHKAMALKRSAFLKLSKDDEIVQHIFCHAIARAICLYMWYYFDGPVAHIEYMSDYFRGGRPTRSDADITNYTIRDDEVYMECESYSRATFIAGDGLLSSEAVVQKLGYDPLLEYDKAKKSEYGIFDAVNKMGLIHKSDKWPAPIVLAHLPGGTGKVVLTIDYGIAFELDEYKYSSGADDSIREGLTASAKFTSERYLKTFATELMSGCYGTSQSYTPYAAALQRYINELHILNHPVVIANQGDDMHIICDADDYKLINNLMLDPYVKTVCRVKTATTNLSKVSGLLQHISVTDQAIKIFNWVNFRIGKTEATQLMDPAIMELSSSKNGADVRIVVSKAVQDNLLSVVKIYPNLMATEFTPEELFAADLLSIQIGSSHNSVVYQLNQKTKNVANLGIFVTNKLISTNEYSGALADIYIDKYIRIAANSYDFWKLAKKQFQYYVPWLEPNVKNILQFNLLHEIHHQVLRNSTFVDNEECINIAVASYFSNPDPTIEKLCSNVIESISVVLTQEIRKEIYDKLKITP
jgi:hypothetical protein